MHYYGISIITLLCVNTVFIIIIIIFMIVIIIICYLHITMTLTAIKHRHFVGCVYSATHGKKGKVRSTN